MGRLKAPVARLRKLDTRAAPPPVKRADAFYLLPEWRGFIGDLIRRRGRCCEACGRKGCRIFGDHRIELKDGGEALDEANIDLLCGSCHSKKTAAARSSRLSIPIEIRDPAKGYGV